MKNTSYIGIIAISIAALVVFAVLLTFVFSRKTADRPKIETAKPTETIRPQKVELGLSWSDVQAICGKANDLTSYETAGMTIWKETYEFNDAAAATGCYGRFTYINHKLDSISR